MPKYSNIRKRGLAISIKTIVSKDDGFIVGMKLANPKQGVV